MSGEPINVHCVSSLYLGQGPTGAGLVCFPGVKNTVYAGFSFLGPGAYPCCY